MTTAKEIIERLPRVMVLGLIIAFGMSLLVMRLWWLQVARESKYDASGEKQSMRTIRLPAARGHIYDRNGVCLADNRPSFNLVLYLEELRTRSGRRGARKGKTQTMELVSEKLQRVSQKISHPLQIDPDEIRNHVDRLMPLPLEVAEDLPQDVVARFSARSDSIPGMDLQVGMLRTYPHGTLAAHVLGYVGRTAFPPDEELSQFYYYMPDMMGKEGVEAQFDDQLRGRAGGKSLTVDVAGYRHAEVGMRLPQPGKDLYLTLDARIQKFVEDAMGDRVGAAVVVDPRNGDILAMASVPSYDANDFSPSISRDRFNQMRNDPNKPFLNRAIRPYEPGSTFKIITLLAGLENGAITPSSQSTCTGSYQVGRRTFNCWIRSRGGSHGVVGLSDAIKHSCNVFFYEYGIKMDAADIVAMARQFKLGEPTGVPLAAYVYSEADRAYQLRKVESRGGLPDVEHRRYYAGDVANIAIGQGEVRATPLQMAYVAAAIANGGMIMEPRLVDRFESQNKALPASQRVERTPPRPRSRLNVSPHHLQLVREAMLRVVDDEDGTGHKAHVPGVRIAGKTGTAQFSKKDPITGEVKPIGHHAWFIAFAPYELPRYAMAIMVEEGDSGGTTCAPIAGQIFRRIFEMENEENRYGLSVTRHSGAAVSKEQRITNNE